MRGLIKLGDPFARRLEICMIRRSDQRAACDIRKPQATSELSQLVEFIRRNKTVDWKVRATWLQILT